MEKFALSFDGYKRHGSFARCASIANRCEATYKKNRAVPNTLDDPRTCLFFEQWRWRHVGQFPDTAAMRYIGALLTKIRRLVRSSRARTKKSRSRKGRTPAFQSSGSATTPPRHPPTIRRPGPSARKTVSVYFHDTDGGGTHRWTLDRLLVMIERLRPHRNGGPDRTFVVGGKLEYLAISTAGPDHFKGQHPLWGEKDTFEGAMTFDDLTLGDVRQILEKFYIGRGVEGCFAPFYGHFQFYVPPKAGTP
ncbi:MAG: hypothetical protein ACREX3_16430 [Gammaproteobacteria bacterium]